MAILDGSSEFDLINETLLTGNQMEKRWAQVRE